MDGGGPGFPPQIRGFTVEITNPVLAGPVTAHVDFDGNVDDGTGTPLGDLDFTANETYGFELVSADVAIYDPDTATYLDPVPLSPGDPNFSAAWLTSIAWASSVTGRTGGQNNSSRRTACSTRA